MNGPAPNPALAPTSRGARLAAAVIFGVVFVWIFQEVLLQGRLLSYRDSLQFYYPLFEFIQQEWEAGRIPLWNMYSNCGEPLLASPTASVLYPAKLIFFLPISYWARYHLYVLGHVVLAGWSLGWVARRWGASLPAATFAALAYAFSGNVLFQYCNVVFLCGAAWLPLAVWSGDRAVRERSWKHVPVFAIVLSLMTLAGDPQMTYVAGVMAALLAVVTWLRERSNHSLSRPDDAPTVPRGRFRHHRLVLLSASALLAFGLAAVQILPTVEFARESTRSTRTVPLSVYDLPAFLLRRSELYPRPDTNAPPAWYDGFLGDPPPPAYHLWGLYNFSFAPCRLGEFLWPNISGNRSPVNHMWLEVLDWSCPPWATSQYFGLLPLLLGISAWQVRKTDPRTRWLSLVALLGLLASFGNYGPGRFLISEPSTLEKFSSTPYRMSGATGGLYWLMVVFLPGFADFRFPAKLLVPVTCALCLLAAAGFDRLIESPRRRTVRFLAAIAVVSCLAALLVTPYQHELADSLDRNRRPTADEFNAELSLQAVVGAFWHGALIAGTLAVFGAWALRRSSTSGIPGNDREQAPAHVRRRNNPLRHGWLFVVLTAVDLGLASRGLVIVTDREDWERTPRLVEYLQRAAAARDPDAVRPPRLHRLDSWVYPLREIVLEFDYQTSVAWERETLYSLQSLPFGLPKVHLFSTVASFLQNAWFDYLRLQREPPLFIQARRAYDAWGAQFFVIPHRVAANDPELSTIGLNRSWRTDDPALMNPLVPGGPELEPAVPGEPLPIPEMPDIRAVYNDGAFPPAWIVHRIHPLEPIPAWREERWVRVLSDLVYPIHRMFDLRAEAYIEDSSLLNGRSGLTVEWPVPEGTPPEECRLTRYSATEVELTATLASDGLVVASETYSDDWIAEVSTDGGPYRPHPVLRTNLTMRGVRLSPGRHSIRYLYRPTAFYAGAVLSAACLAGLLLGGVLAVRRRSRRTSGFADS
jgi:hypothetical protein